MITRSLRRGTGRLLLMATVCAAFVGPARAASVRDGIRCLQRYDLGCARQALREARANQPDAPETLWLDARLRFYEGDYEGAVADLDTLHERGITHFPLLQDFGLKNLDDEEAHIPYRPTRFAARDFVAVERDGIEVRYADGMDRILADEAVSTLAKARRTIDDILGGGPPQKVVLDIFPTAERFVAASGLPADSVRATGVIALSKWSRLLITSPRARARGYGWKDTIAHEYVHLVVAWCTGNRAPVWLQEGLAKFLEVRWKPREDPYAFLSTLQQSLLAKAIRDDRFVPFDKFKRSMAFLDDGDEAALAFAQVATMIAFLTTRSGMQVLPELLDRVRDGEPAERVVADLARYPDFDAFKEGWKAWIKSLPLVKQELAALPVVLDGEGDAYADDPLLSGHPELARYARLGDLLRERGHPEAALVEYGKAKDPDGQPSPLLLAREAECYLELKDPQAALSAVNDGVKLYPEFTPLQVVRGRALDALQRNAEALAAWQAAHDLNPFDPEVEAALVRDHSALGQVDAAKRHARYLRIIQAGGARVADAAR